MLPWFGGVVNEGEVFYPELDDMLMGMQDGSIQSLRWSGFLSRLPDGKNPIRIKVARVSADSN